VSIHLRRPCREGSTLNPKCRIARYIALAVGAVLCGIGILHDIVNIRSVTRAIARGEIVVFLLSVASDLEKGKRLAWRVAFAVGIFLIISGVAGYWWQPIPRVLIFSAVGVVLTGPLLLWRKHFFVE